MKAAKLKAIYLIVFIALIVHMLGCSSNETKIRERELALKEKELEIREKEIREKENSRLNDVANRNNNSTYNQVVENPKPIPAKFVYVIFLVKEPKLYHTAEKLIGGEIMPESNYVIPEEIVHTTEIKEIPSYDENKQYEYMDKMEAQVRQQLSYKNMNFKSDLFMKVRDENERAKLEENECEVVSRKLKVFDTYKEASVFRNNNKGKF